MYRHLAFRKRWELSPSAHNLLGQCEAYVESICNTPILPEFAKHLLSVSLVKGAQATTAIEGNTLSESEINQILAKNDLPPSKKYQKQEVENVLEAFNTLMNEVVYENQIHLITPDLIKRFHTLIAKNLEGHIDAEPGRFRRDSRVVGPYRCPEYRQVPELIEKYCDWLRTEFHFQDKPSFSDTVIEAIVAHIYLEWIHPFPDGNGRTGRLIEFYILLRGGLPNIASHILSNHYNETRVEYYRHFEEARKANDLSRFIEYSLLGFRDGLRSTLGIIQIGLRDIAWDKFVYDEFQSRRMTNKNVFNRQRALALKLPHHAEFKPSDLISDPKGYIALLYKDYSPRTVSTDLKVLEAMDIVVKVDNGRYMSNRAILINTAARRMKPSR